MSGFKAGNGAAKALIRLRVILAGEGVVREERGVFRATLPGNGYLVEIDDRAGTSQMMYPSGRLLSAALDLAHEGNFASFMHNVDNCIASEGRIPSELLLLADEYARACAEGDMALSSIVAEGNLDLGSDRKSWRLGPAFRALGEAARWTDDRHLSDVAEDAVRLANDATLASQPFSDARSQLRWLDLIERWGSAGAASVTVGESAWVEIMTRSGLQAAARRIDVPLGEILTTGDGGRLALEHVGAYRLVDGAGNVTAVGIAHDGDLTVHQAEGAEPVDDEVEALRSETFANVPLPRGP